MKKSVFALTSLSLLLIAGCGSTANVTESSGKTTSDTGDVLPDTDEKKSDASESVSESTSEEEPSPKKNITNVTKGGVLNADVNLNVVLAELSTSFKGLPVSLNYATKDGVFDLDDGDKNVELRADLTKANATDDASATDNAINNINGFTNLVTIPKTLSSLSSYLPVSLSDVFPGQYKAMGYEFTKMKDTLSKAKTDDDKKTALDSLGSEEVSLYLNDSAISLSETHNTSNPRAYVSKDINVSDNTDSLQNIIAIIAALQDFSVSDLEKIDFVTLINGIEDGTLISDDVNDKMKEIYTIVEKVGDILVGGFNIDKTSSKATDGTEDVTLKFYLNDSGKNNLSSYVQKTLKSIDGIPSLLDTFIDTFDVQDVSFSVTLYKGKDSYTRFGGFDFNVEFSVGSYDPETDKSDTRMKSNITVDLDMDRTDTSIAEDYFDNLKVSNAQFAVIADEFDRYYEKVGKSVSYYTGDSASSGIDITTENGEVLDDAVNSYDSLSEGAKFMLTDAVTKDTIKTAYNKGRETLTKAITTFNKKKTKNMSAVSTSFKSVSAYKNWQLALEEEDADTYNNVKTIEDEYLTSLETSVESAITAANEIEGYDGSNLTYFSSTLPNVRKELKNLLSSTVLGIVVQPTYKDAIFVTDELVARRNTLASTAEGSSIYNLETASIDAFLKCVNQFDNPTTDTCSASYTKLADVMDDYYKIVATNSLLDDATDIIITKATESYKTSYTTFINMYYSVEKDNLVTAYTNLKASYPASTDTSAWTTAVNNSKKLRTNIQSIELNLFGEEISNSNYQFMAELEALGQNYIDSNK